MPKACSMPARDRGNLGLKAAGIVKLMAVVVIALTKSNLRLTFFSCFRVTPHSANFRTPTQVY